VLRYETRVPTLARFTDARVESPVAEFTTAFARSAAEIVGLLAGPRRGPP